MQVLLGHLSLLCALLRESQIGSPVSVSTRYSNLELSNWTFCSSQLRRLHHLFVSIKNTSLVVYALVFCQIWCVCVFVLQSIFCVLSCLVNPVTHWTSCTENVCHENHKLWILSASSVIPTVGGPGLASGQAQHLYRALAVERFLLRF